MQITWSSQLHTPAPVTIEHTASITRSFEFFQNKSQFWVSCFVLFFNIHSLLTFKCYPFPTKRTLCKTERKLWQHLETRSLGEQAQGNGKGEMQWSGCPCPTGSQLLVSTWKVSRPRPTKLDMICFQLSPL